MVCQDQLSLVSKGLKPWNVQINEQKTTCMGHHMTRVNPPPLLLTGFRFSGVTTIASNERAKNTSQGLTSITVSRNICPQRLHTLGKLSPTSNNQAQVSKDLQLLGITQRSISRFDPETLNLVPPPTTGKLFFFLSFKSVSALVPEFKCRYTKHIF